MSWEEAWREGRTGWDQGRAAPPLLDWLASYQGAPGRALVPGAGAGYDVVALAQAGWLTTGLDLAPGAAERFAELKRSAGPGGDRARFAIADFFAFEPDKPYDLVWDYTFLCAIDPGLRADWADKMAALLRPGATLLTLLFPVDDDDPTPSSADDPGPPYRLHPELARRLLANAFIERSMAKPPRSHPGREAKEWLGVWERRA